MLKSRLSFVPVLIQGSKDPMPGLT